MNSVYSICQQKKQKKARHLTKKFNTTDVVYDKLGEFMNT